VRFDGEETDIEVNALKAMKNLLLPWCGHDGKYIEETECIFFHICI
jgi:hypothetical protein